MTLSVVADFEVISAELFEIKAALESDAKFTIAPTVVPLVNAPHVVVPSIPFVLKYISRVLLEYIRASHLTAAEVAVHDVTYSV